MTTKSKTTPLTLSRRQFLRVTAAGAGAVALISVTGCGATPTPTQPPKPAASPTPAATATAVKKSVTLVYWCYPYWTGITGKEVGPQYTTYDYPNAKGKEYTAMNPNVTVQIEPVDYTTGKEKLDIAIVAKKLPDVSREDFAEVRKRMVQGVLEPIDDFVTQEDRDDRLFMDICMYKGKRYSWPLRANAGPFFVNRALFKERNALDLLPKNAERDWTWDEFFKAAQAVTFDRNNDGKKDVYGYCMHFKDDPGGYHRTIFMWNFGARVFSDDGSRCVINSAEGIKGVQYLLDLQDKYDVLLPGGVSFDRAGIRTQFQLGRAAMMSDNGDFNTKILLAIKDGTIKAESMDAWPVRTPHLPGQPPVMYSDQNGYIVFSQTDSYKRSVAMDFCRFMTSKENIRNEVASEVFPARKSAADVYPGNEYMAYLATLVGFTASKDSGHPYYFDYRHLETFMFQAVLTHQKSPKDALDELAAGTNDVLKKAGYQ